MAETIPRRSEPEKGSVHHGETKLDESALMEAKMASVLEHNMSIWEALKANYKAIGWSLLISLSIVMEGYDTILIYNFFGYPAFEKKYGKYFGPELGWQMEINWQSALSNASSIGGVIGTFLNGWLCARFGYRKVMIVSLFLMIAFIFIPVFAPNVQTLFAGQILCGLPWAVFASVGVAYASEVMPLHLRAYLTSYVNLCWATGQFIAAGVLYGFLKRDDEWSYRIPYALQWVWPVPLIVGCLFVPESPWYLCRTDRIEEAKRTIRRLGPDTMTDDQVNGQLYMMLHTIQLEEEATTGGSYWDCLKGINLRRTEICVFVFMGQNFCGSPFGSQPSYFMQQAGLAAPDAFGLNLGGTGIAFVGTILSWFLIPQFGRRTIYFTGMLGDTILLLLIGIISVSSEGSASLWAQGSLSILWLFVYSLSIGPICYAIVSETSAVRLRPQTISLARNAYSITLVICGVLGPHMLNPTAWNWKGKAAFFWCGTAFLMCLWIYFRLPECKSRSYEELNIMFENKIGARDFSKYKVDAYAADLKTSEHVLKTEE